MLEQLITDHLDLWTSAVKPRSITGRGSNSRIELTGIKKLRELILELAVRGLLVPQDPSDEPASVLLEKIAVEKKHLINDGKIKKPKVLPEITDDEKSYRLPNGWEWERFPNISQYKTGKTPSTKNSIFWSDRDIDTPWVSIADMSHFGRVSNTNKRVTQEARDQVFKYEPIPAGSLLMSFKLTVGKVSILDVDAFHNEAIISIQPFKGMSKEYLFKFLPNRALAGNTKSAIKGNTLNADSLSLLIIPVPPLAEQHRIVAKVDELMALCDQLELQQTKHSDTHLTLVTTLLESLSQTSDADQFQAVWSQLFTHFDTLFTTEASIDQLKQAILQLAVMGKLVPQDPRDEHASILLEKIAAEKAQLIKDGKIKKQKCVSEVLENESIFHQPKGWASTKLQIVTTEISTGPFGSMIHKRDYKTGGVPLINPSHMRGGKIVEDIEIAVDELKAEELISYILNVDDIVMARRGEVGRCAIVTEREKGWLCGTGSFVVKFIPEVSRSYIYLLFKTKSVRDYLTGKSVGTTMTNLNHGILNKMSITLPPAAEQHRIAAKVDELMVLCDKLKTHIRQAQTTNQYLATSVTTSSINN